MAIYICIYEKRSTNSCFSQNQSRALIAESNNNIFFSLLLPCSIPLHLYTYFKV